ncbi:MAG: hypothetical protein JXR68_12745 [Bacteroidales bacterium]|nr:hypothetical protein [Bacteroidales bacterium]
MSNIIQTTRTYTKSELETGINLDFISNAKTLKGIQIINPEGNVPIYQSATISVKVERGIYLEDTTLICMLQASTDVPPNQRYFTLAGRIETPSKKCFIQVKQPTTEADFIISFLLED